MREITQKAISFKIDIRLLDELDRECGLGYKRNRLINDAVAMFLEARDARRLDASIHHFDNRPHPRVMTFIKKYLTPRAHMFLDLIDYH